MPNQLCDLKNIVEVPVLESKADPQFFYIYSVFFRDYLSFTRVDEIIKANPESHLMIIMGSGHSLRRFPFSLTEERKKTAEFYGIETDKYCHTLGAFLETSFDPVFVVSRISQRNSERSLEKYTRGAGKLAITEDEDVT